MKVLIASPYPEELLAAFHNSQDEVVATTADPPDWPVADWLVSYGYRTIIGKVALEPFQGRTANIHLSLLPLNRGADCNFWSFYDNTAKGVSIHRIAPSLDTGPLYGQCEMRFNEGHTLKTSYEALRRAAALHFCAVWPNMRDGTIKPYKQVEGHTYHRSADKEEIWARLPLGWDTPVKTIQELGREYREQTGRNFYGEPRQYVAQAEPENPRDQT